MTFAQLPAAAQLAVDTMIETGAASPADVEELFGAGLVTPDPFSGKYVPTDAGREVVQARRRELGK